MAIPTPERIKFLIALASSLKTGAVKTIKQAMDFAKQQFGKIDQSFVDDIVNVFKKEGKTKKGDVVPIKKKEGIETLSESQKYDQSLFEQKGMGILKKSLEKQKKELEKATELEKLSSELLEEAKNRKIVKKRTDDMAKGDVTGETSDLMKGIEDKMTSIKKTADELKKVADEPKLDLTELDAKLDEIGKEKAIRIRKQNEEVERRTGKSFKQGPSLEDDVNLKGEIHPKTDQLSDKQREFLGFPNRTVEAIVRTAARDVLEKAGLGSRIRGQDPIDMARQIYGDEILDALDNISEELLEASSYPEISRILSDKKIYNFKPRQGLNVRQKGEIEDITAFDPEGRDPSADGGIIGNLRLNRTDYKIGGAIKLYKAGQGKFTKAQVLIQRLENTIKAYIGKKDKLAKYVQETFPNFIKEIKANPKLADNENVWKTLGQDLPSDQELVVYGDDTVDFFRQTEGPGNIDRVTKFLEKNPFLNKEEALKIMKMKPTDQVMEVERLKTIRTKKHALGGRVQMADGGLIDILKL